MNKNRKTNELNLKNFLLLVAARGSADGPGGDQVVEEFLRGGEVCIRGVRERERDEVSGRERDETRARKDET